MREFGSGKNDWYCWLQDAIVVSGYLIETPRPPPGLEAPHRLSTRLHISQMLHPPTALLLIPPPQTNSYLQSNFSVCTPQIWHSRSVCPPAAHPAVVRFPSSVTFKEPGNVGVMGGGDRSFVGVNTHDLQSGRPIMEEQ